MIKPQYWLENLTIRKFNASFRMFGDKAKSPEQISDNYTGYCIAKNDRLEEHPTGIFISACKVNDESMYLILECQDAKSYDLWIELIDIFSEISGASIQLGEVILNKTLWKNRIKREYLKKA